MLPKFCGSTSSISDHHASGYLGPAVIVLIFTLGISLRIFACQNTYIINPDGIYYIQQAKAIYYGQWQHLTSCLPYISVYPFFIAIVYPLFHDWIIAGKFVSLFFGSITLIPFYYLCRHFFKRDISALILLIFAVLPVLVSWSAGVLRDPVAWFFLTLGLYFFIVWNHKHERLSPLFACIFLVIASWARIENSLFLIVTFIYLLAISRKEGFIRLAFFSLPLFIIISIIYFNIIFVDKSIVHILRLDDIVREFSQPLRAYKGLRAELKNNISSYPTSVLASRFLKYTPNMIFLMAFGVVVKYIIRAYFYIFFLFFVLGIVDFYRNIKKDLHISYLFVLCLSSFFLLYYHMFYKWMMFDRILIIFVFPAFAVIGFGLQRAMLIMNNKFRLSRAAALCMICLLILVFALPKNLKSKEDDKVVYKEVGELIAQIEGNDEEIRLLSSLRMPSWPSFYANVNFEGAPCPQIDLGMGKGKFERKVFKDYETFVRYLRKGDIDYFLWEEKAWPKHGFDFLKAKQPDHLQKIGSWRHPDVGRIILYKVVL